MKTIVLQTKTAFYNVVINNDSSLLITKHDGKIIDNCGQLISQYGGVDKLLLKCIETTLSFEDYVVQQREQNRLEAESRKQAHSEYIKKYEEKENKEWDEISCLSIIPATVENVRRLLRHLHKQNWGGWSLPQLSIGYSAHQYDCDGVIATIITLDLPLSDSDLEIKNQRKFKVGGKRGHLTAQRNL